MSDSLGVDVKQQVVSRAEKFNRRLKCELLSVDFEEDTITCVVPPEILGQGICGGAVIVDFSEVSKINVEPVAPLEDLVVEDYRKLNQKERKLVYRFIRAVVARNKENIDYCVALLKNEKLTSS